jgi:hypothetical protein
VARVCARRRDHRREAERKAQPPIPVATAVAVRAQRRGSPPPPDEWREVASAVGAIVANGAGVTVALKVGGVKLTVARRV